MVSSPTTSVVVAAFNAATTIEATLTTILDGELAPGELIVVDDGSTDGTFEVVKAIADPRLRTLRHLTNRGPSAARNTGARDASGDVLAFVDADDHPDAAWLRTFVSLFDGNVGLVGCACLIEENGHQRVQLPAPEPSSSTPDATRTSRPLFLAGTWAVRRSVFIAAGGYDETLRHGENYELGRRLLAALRECGLAVATTNDALLTYRKISKPLMIGDVRARWRVAETMLQRHRAALDSRQRANYHRIAGVALIRLCQPKPARRHLWQAAREGRFMTSDVLRAGIATFPPLARRLWPSPKREVVVRATLRTRLELALARLRAVATALRAIAGGALRRALPRPIPTPVAPYPMVFVVGCPRSGTSWVQQLLQSHPRAVGTEESYAFRRLRNAASAGWNPIGWARLFYGLDRDRILRLHVGLDYWVDRATLRRYAEFALARGRTTEARHQMMVRAVFDGYVLRQHHPNPVLVEKTPFHLHFVDEILRWFPEAKIVEVVRDGRDVVASMRRLPAGQTWAPTRLESQLRLWTEDIELGEDLRRRPDAQGRVMTIRYENLHDHPEAEVRRLFAFCELQADDEMVREIVGELEFDRARAAGRGLHLHSGTVGAWREAFSDDEKALILERAGTTLMRAGYTV